MRNYKTSSADIVRGRPQVKNKVWIWRFLRRKTKVGMAQGFWTFETKHTNLDLWIHTVGNFAGVLKRWLHSDSKIAILFSLTPSALAYLPEIVLAGTAQNCKCMSPHIWPQVSQGTLFWNFWVLKLCISNKNVASVSDFSCKHDNFIGIYNSKRR